MRLNKLFNKNYFEDFSNLSITAHQWIKENIPEISKVVGGSSHTIVLKNDNTLWGIEQIKKY